MKTYLDAEGLTYVTDAMAYADALDLTYDEVVGNRRSLLSQLRHGAGVTILTGPMGAPYWSVVGPEVQVKIVPDGEVYSERVSDAEWPFVAVGGTRAEARRLVARTTRPRPRTYMRPQILWDLAVEMGAAPASTTPIIITDYDVQTWTVEEACQYLEQSRSVCALDWEWSIDDDTYLEPIGLAVADATTTAWVPVWTPEGRDVVGGESLRRSVATFLQGGGAAIWHDARADLGTQYPGDPLELVPNYRGHDTKIMMFLNGDVQLSLKQGARKYLHREPVEFGAFAASLQHVDAAAVARYAGADGRNTFDLWMRLTAALGRKEQLDLSDVFRRLLPLWRSMAHPSTWTGPVSGWWKRGLTLPTFVKRWWRRLGGTCTPTLTPEGSSQSSLGLTPAHLTKECCLVLTPDGWTLYFNSEEHARLEGTSWEATSHAGMPWGLDQITVYTLGSTKLGP